MIPLVSAFRDHWHDQTGFTRNRDSDVVVVFENDFVFRQRGVDVRKLFQRLTGGGDNEWHIGDANPVFFLDAVNILLTEFDQPSEIALVESGYVRRGLFRFHHVLGNQFAHARNRKFLDALARIDS